jgi:transcriptional regulator with XRE-family HTH domain
VNVNQQPDRKVDPGVWERQDMRAALAERNIGAVFRLLQQVGVSQRRIAALTGRSQSEISEILSGRQVMAYDVLVRIADGLGVARGYLGLAYDRGTGDLTNPQQDRAATDETEQTRRLLARSAEVTIGAAVLNVDSWSHPLERTTAPVPARIGSVDIDRLVSITRVGKRLHLALADLHNLAGWTSFDVGLYVPARLHFARALEQAKYANEPSLVAKVLYCIGRLYLHRNLVLDALRFFQLGQLAAQESGCELAVAMLCANEAWAYALLGRSRQAFISVGRAQDEFTRASRDDAPAWVRFFGVADLHASIAMTRAFLPEPTAKQRAEAIQGFGRSLAERGSGMARSRAFELTALATVHLYDGDLDHGAAVGHQAVDLAEQVRSTRIVDRMTPLQTEAEKHSGHDDLRGLAERIATIRSA